MVIVYLEHNVFEEIIPIASWILVYMAVSDALISVFHFSLLCLEFFFRQSSVQNACYHYINFSSVRKILRVCMDIILLMNSLFLCL